MKIKKTPVKKLAIPPLPIRTLIKTLRECPQSEIGTHIEATPQWSWPRGDLFHWVGVLNRFDEILENICKSYDMKKPQPKEFSHNDRRLVLAILAFSRLLLESCTNRNLYASYEQLNDLLHTRDLDILESCLRLLLRPAQRHSAQQRSARSIFTVSQDRLLALAHSWGSREYGLDLQQLADDNAVIPEGLRMLSFQFYRTVSLSKHAPKDDPLSTSIPSVSSSTAVPPSGKQRRSSGSGASASQHSASIGGNIATTFSSVNEGVVVIQTSDLHQLGESDYEILNHLTQEYQVPEEHQFQLLSRIRVATGISNPSRRQQLLIIRLLAIAVMGHVLSEAVIVEKLFAFEPEIIQSLADLIHPDHNVPFNLQAVALFALDGLAHLRNKQLDVLTAINASASHGILLYALRKIIAGLDSENAPYPQEFMDAMFGLISFIICSQTGGTMVISAGIVPVLLQLFTNRHTTQLKNVTKSVTILDSLVYGFGSAFTSFCTSGGLNHLVARIKEEVDFSLSLVRESEASRMTDVTFTDKNASKDEETSPIPFERTALLKAMFKFVIHMMQSPGTQEGLRNLIDTSLPETLKTIMENPAALGTSVFAHAINTMTSFIHNEPTSLAILQEAKIPQTLLASLSNDIPASNDVAMNLPGAFGAICLNAAGLEMFTKEFSLKKFFEIFTSISHVRAFQDSDITSTLGISMDELVRHQPTLKAIVMTEIVAMLKQVLKMCEADQLPADDLMLCTLQKTRAMDAPPPGEIAEDDISKDTTKDSLVAQLIEGCARFCESFFQNTSNTSDFLKADGIDILMKFYTLPTLPYDLANTPAFFTMSHLLKLLSETNPSTAIAGVVKEVNRMLADIQPLLESSNVSSDLVQYIDISGSSPEEIEQGNHVLRTLTILNGLTGLLSDMYCATAFSHGRNSVPVLAAFVEAQGDKALTGLGQLHRMCVWETIALKRTLHKNWIGPKSKAKSLYYPSTVPGVIEDDGNEPTTEDKDKEAIKDSDKEMTTVPTVDVYTPSAINTKYFKFVLTQIPHYITPMYLGISKMLYNRRDYEEPHRANAFKIADSLSRVLQSNIEWRRIDGGLLTEKYTYLQAMVGLLPFLFLDDRNPATLQTMMVVSFVRTGNLESVFTWLDSFWTEAASIHASSVTLEGEQGEILRKVHRSIEVLLGVLQILTSSKQLLESSHTSVLISKDDNDRRKDFFDAHEFLVDVRLQVLPRIKSLWMDRQLDRSPAALVRHIIQVILNILKASGEQKPPVPATPPVVVGTSSSNIFAARPLVPDAASVATLLDMGFPRSAAELALTRCGNQLDRATEYLLTHQEVVAAAIYEQEREEAAARAAAIAAANEAAPQEPTAESSSDVPAVNYTESQTGVSQQGRDDSQSTATNVNDAQDDDDDIDEEEMLRQALEMSQAQDATMSGDEAPSAPHTQEPDLSENPPSTSASAPQPAEMESIDAEAEEPSDKAMKEEEYKAALELHKLHKEELSKGRDEFKPLLVTRSLELIESIDDIVFPVRDLLVYLCKEKDSDVIEVLAKEVEKVAKALNDKSVSSDKAFATRLRLLALLSGDVVIQSKIQEYSATLAPLLTTILANHVESQAPQAGNTWISPLLLMIEGFLSLSDEPKVVPDDTTSEGKTKEAMKDKTMSGDIIAGADMERLLQYMITLLKQPDLTKDIALAVFRILVRLTRHHTLAMEFLNIGGLERVFSTLKPERIGVQGQQNFIVMIMRHIIEDTVILQSTMEREIVRWFSQSTRSRTGDIQSYLRHNSFLGLRDLDAFVAGTLNMCKVYKFDSSFRTQQLTLAKTNASSMSSEDRGESEQLKDENDKGKETVKETPTIEGSSSDKPSTSTETASVISDASKKYSSEISETVIHFLVTELLRVRGAATSPSLSTPNMDILSSGSAVAEPSNSSAIQAESLAKDKQTLHNGHSDANFIHRCFVLQCLNELLISYPPCKVDLMNYSRRKGSKDPSNVASKPRTNWLSYLLNDLIPYRGTVLNSSETELKKHSIESNFASSVLVALCSNYDEGEEKKPFSELVQVRRFIVDGIIRSFKDAIGSSEPVEIKYGKFLSLSELSYKILGSSPSAGSAVKANDDMSINIVKVMLEKNFITTLTNVLADIDLNYPHAKILVNAVLKPLEHLTKLSLKMSRAADPGARMRRQSTPLSGTGSGTVSGDDAPDLYRNSSLGMFDGANIESEEEDESDDSAEEDDFLDADDYEEEAASDASDLSEQDLSDEDDDDEDLEGIVERNPFHHHTHEISDDEEEHDDEDMEGDGDEEMESALHEALDGDDDEEMMEWNADSGPIIMREDDVGDIINEEDDDPQIMDPEYYEERDRAHRLHTPNPRFQAAVEEIEDGMDDDEEDGDEDDEDDEDDDQDDEDEDDIEEEDLVLLDDVDGFDPIHGAGRNGPWDMSSTFVINDQSGLLNGAQVINLRGRRPRTGGRRLDDRGFFWADSAADQGRFSYIEDDEFPLLGAPARNPFLQVSDDVITHPLLAPPRPAPANAAIDGQRRGGSRGIGVTDWHSFEELLSGNASQVLGTLVNGGAIRAGHGAFRVELNHNHASVAPVDRTNSRGVASGETAAGTGSASTSADMFSTVHDFVPFSTSQRWSQECRMMYGPTAQDKASRLANHLINALIPVAKEEHRLKLERDAKEQEQRRKAEAERKRIAEEKRKAEEEAERIRKEEEEKIRIAEEAAAAEREAALQAEEAAARAARGEPEEPESAVEDSAMEVEQDSTSAPIEPSTVEAGPTVPVRRIVVIDGEMVDITDSDIDPEFLEALPEDMRREVYNDYLQSQRPVAPASQPPTSTMANPQSINADFLEALPQNMRAELDEIIRSSSLGAGGGAGSDSLLSAINEYTLSRLAPQLRQLYQEGGSGSSLMDASALLDRLPRDYPGLRGARSILAPGGAGSSSATAGKRSAQPRDAIQLVDKSSLATLVRLMFLPQPLSKNILNKLLVNLCENSKTRSELLSLLLSILQDGGADLAAVDKSFAQMSLRGKPTHNRAHQSNHKGKGLSSALSTPVPAAMDNVPNLVARRCFEALYYIVSFNPQAALFFLSEHDNVSFKRPPLSKKGKGKERVVISKYPIVLLLDLLERPTFVENAILMEQLMTLLALLCRPLATLAKDEEKDKKDEEKDKKDEEKNKDMANETEAISAASAPAAESTVLTTIGGSNSASATVAESSRPSVPTAPAGPASSIKDGTKAESKAAETEPSVLKPPVIPDHCIQLVVCVLTAGECSSRTFQYTLSVIQNLSVLDGARDVITTELVNAARGLGEGILEDLSALSQKLSNAISGVDVQGVALEKFSPASSKQAKLLRVLKTIDYMYSRKQNPTQVPAATQTNIELAPTVDPEEADAIVPRTMRDVHAGGLNLNKDEERVTEIYDSLQFHSLWTAIGDTLEMIHERSDMIHVATVLLPLIESFMVVCKYVGLRPSTLEVEETECKAMTSSTEELFLQFTEKHSKVLNIMVRNNPALMSGSFSLLVHNPKMLEFDNKRNYFTQQLHKRNPARDHYGTLQMNVRREMVFVDSFSQLQSRTGEEIKYSKLNVHFHGEEGVDAGGVTREWFQVLARQMFNPDYALFKTSAADKLTYQPNRASWANSDHLLFFKFIGRVIGKAIYDGRLLDAYFTRSFYKHILGRPVDYRDVEAVDPEYYKSLVWMLDNDITDIVDETFSVETDDFGNKKIVDLKPDGRNIPVTEENKHEYVKYITEQKLTLAIKDQIHSFLQGFHEIIPAHLISIFNEQELELLISGLPDIDVDEWKNNAEYQNYSPASPQIQHFWRAVRSFDQTERAKLLQFVTGTSKVPLGGFSQLQGISGVQKFQIHKDFSSTKRLPSAHTCFNQLDLPEYETYEELRQQLLTAISECSTGFAFA